MSEELYLTTVMRMDPRNPYDKLVFSPNRLGAQYDFYVYSKTDLSKDALVRTFRNITNSKFMRITVPGKEEQLILSLQKLLLSKTTIPEMVLTAESDPPPPSFEDLTSKSSLTRSTTRIATLTLSRVKVSQILMGEDEGKLFYHVKIDLSGGSGLTTY